MKHLTILVPEGQNNVSSIVGVYKIFTRSNEYYKKTGRKELFKIELAGIAKKVGWIEKHDARLNEKQPNRNVSIPDGR